LQKYIKRIFQVYHKYTHGIDLRNTAREMVKLIIRANNSRNKSLALEELSICFEESRLILIICKELKGLKKFKSFETAINQVTTKMTPLNQ